MRNIGAFACFVLAGLAAPPPAGPGGMNGGTIPPKADTPKGRGFGGLGSPDIKLLYGEANAAGKTYRETIAADKKAGHTPHSCPPKTASLNSEQLLAHLRTYPAAVRPKTTITTAMFDAMKKRYPCT